MARLPGEILPPVRCAATRRRDAATCVDTDRLAALLVAEDMPEGIARRARRPGCRVASCRGRIETGE